MNRLFNIVLTALVFVSGSAFAGCSSCKKSTTKTMQRKHGRRLSPRVAVRSAALHRIRGTKKVVSRRSYRPVGKSRTGVSKRKSVTAPVMTPSQPVPNALGAFILSQAAKRECKDGSCKR